MDVTSYLLGKKSGGGTPINNQNKNVTITENGTTTVSADAGYTGLGTVGITTNVQPNLESKSVTITENTTTTITPTSGKDGLSSVSVTTNVSSSIGDYFDSSLSNGSSGSSGLNRIIKKVPSDLTISGTSASYMFNACSGLTTIPLLDTSSIVRTDYMFYGCSNLKEIPLLDTSSVANFKSMFQYCTNLETVPVLNTSNVTVFTSMFSQCDKLTDASLNNILQMCINATKYNDTKTLYQLGIQNSNVYPASRIQALSNYQDFVNAGWTIS